MEDDLHKEELINLRKLTAFKSESDLPKHTSNNLACTCSICEAQKQIKFDPVNEIQVKENFVKFEGQDFSFTSLLQELGKAANEHPLKINIPETAVFHKSRPSFLITQKSDKTLKMITSGKMLSLSELRKLFPTTARLRKRDENSPQKQLPENLSKEVALVQFMQREYDNEMDFINPWNEDGALRIFQESDFLDLFTERAGSHIWKRINYIQGVVKAKTGLNGSYFITYYSHTLNDHAAISELEKAGRMSDDKYEQSLMSDNLKYAEHISKKIAYILAVFSQIEILRFKPEFIKDENGKIWFFCASRIAIRRIDFLEPETFLKKVQLRTSEKKEKLNEELQCATLELNAPHQLRMKNEMVEFYDKIKKRTGVSEILKDKPPDSRSNEAFRQLRPYSPYVFTQLMNPSFKISGGVTERVQRTASVKRIHSRQTSRIRVEEIKPKKVLTARSGLQKWGSMAKTTSKFTEKIKGWIRTVK